MIILLTGHVGVEPTSAESSSAPLATWVMPFNSYPLNRYQRIVFCNHRLDTLSLSWLIISLQNRFFNNLVNIYRIYKYSTLLLLTVLISNLKYSVFNYYVCGNLFPQQNKLPPLTIHVHLPEKLLVKKEKINLLYCELGGFGMCE